MPTHRGLVTEPVPRRRAIAAACVGNLMEWYDFALYGALAAVLAHEFFPAQGGTTNLIPVFAVYATAFITRPVGAVIFGKIGDTRGRRGVLAVAIVLMTIASTGVGVLPGYTTIGILAPILLVALRALQGVAAGGEVGVSAVFLTEHAPPGKRGVLGAWHTATQSLGIGAAFAVAITVNLGSGDAGTTTGVWRWAFIAAAPLGLTGVYLRRKVRDGAPPALLPTASGARPRSPWWRTRMRGLLTGLAVIATGSLCFNVFFIFMPNHVSAVFGISLPACLACAGAGLVVTAGSALTLGRLSDRIGRRPVVVVSSAATVVLAIPLVLGARSGTLAALAVVNVAVGVLIGGLMSMSLLTELFPPEVRARGLAITAGLGSAVIGGTAPLVSQVLVASMQTPVLLGGYVAAVAAACAVCVFLLDETAFRPFARPTSSLGVMEEVG